MIGSTCALQPRPCVCASHETTPIEIRYAMPAAARVIERCKHRAEVAPEDERHEQHRRELDPGEVVVDLVRLRERAGDEAGRLRRGSGNDTARAYW